MLALIQRVTTARVDVAGETIANINQGILALVGIEKADTLAIGEKLLKRTLDYRIFNDADNKMNLSLRDVQGGLLLVPQFTLVAETNKGTRPGFSNGMPPKDGDALFTQLVQLLRTEYPHSAFGKFGANMQITLVNDGPVTFILNAK